MLSSELSKNSSFYQLACHATDTFTSCIKIYEALLPYFEAERSDDGVNRRLWNIGRMLSILYNELTSLKSEITTVIVIDHADDQNGSKQSVESEGLLKVLNEYYQQKHIICESNAVEKKESYSGKVCNKLPKKSWEDIEQVISEEHQRENVNDEGSKIKKTISCDEKVLMKQTETITKQTSDSGKDIGQVPSDEHQREKVKNEDKKVEKTISHYEKVLMKQTESIKRQANDFEYLCVNCDEAVTMYNQDLDLSIALHNQDGCCRGNPSKLISAQKERQEKKLNMISAHRQVQHPIKYQEATNRFNLTPADLDPIYKVGHPHFSYIQPTGNRFICTVCNKYLSGPKIFLQHVEGDSHQKRLKESGKVIQKSSDCGTEVTYIPAIKNSGNNSPASVVKEESTLLEKIQFLDIVKSLSGSLYSQRQYFSFEKGNLMCNLCGREIPPTSTNARGHVLGKRHLTKLNNLFSPTEGLELK